MSFLDQLNERQREAATTLDGPLLIIAGAGAGKTKTLVARVANLIAEGVAPYNILAITFTNKAAKEMKERVQHQLATESSLNTPVSMDESPFVSTFHALGVHILREYADRLGMAKRFTIADRSDSKAAIRESLKELGYDPKQYDPGKILGIISSRKGEAMDWDHFQAETHDSPMHEAAAAVWEKYAGKLKQDKAFDFDDLLLKTLQLLERDNEVREHYQQLWQYVHIDEYQDTNHVQYRIARLLAEPQQNMCVVGDVDQNIYSWRGAQIANILNFERDYPDARIVALEENYRSTQTIINAANRVIEKNQERLEKNLYTRNTEGEAITIAGFRTEHEEARWIADSAKELISQGVPASEIAVLYRTNVQSRVLEEAMLDRDVPYQILGTRFFERKEVKDVLSYIRAAMNPDSRADFQRIVNTPTRGIGKATMMRMLEGRESELSAKQMAAASDFRRILENIRSTAETAPPSELVSYVIRESGLDAALKKEGTEDAEERRANMYELATLASKYDELYSEPSDGLEALLADAALASDQDQMSEESEAVKLMTVHAAKGLEFDRVFVAGMEHDLFPQAKDDPADQEEERRLFYVAMTRARTKLYLTYAGMRTIFGQRDMQMPSSFLEELDEELVERDEPESKGTGLLDDDPLVRIEW